MIEKLLLDRLRGLLANNRKAVAVAQIPSTPGGLMNISAWDTATSYMIEFSIRVNATGIKGDCVLEMTGRHAHELRSVIQDRTRISFADPEVIDIDTSKEAGPDKSRKVTLVKAIIPPGLPLVFKAVQMPKKPSVGDVTEALSQLPSALISVPANGSNRTEMKSAFTFTEVGREMAVATDGHRLAGVTGDFPVAEKAYVSNRMLEQMRDIVSETGDRRTKYGFSKTHLVFQHKTRDLSWMIGIPIQARLKEDSFPDVSSFFSKRKKWKGAVDRASLQDMLDTMSVIKDAKSGSPGNSNQLLIVKLESSPWRVLMDYQVDDSLLGGQSCMIPNKVKALEGGGPDDCSEVIFGVNPEYFMAAVRHITGPEIVIEADEAREPVRISNPDGTSVSIVMPVDLSKKAEGR